MAAKWDTRTFSVYAGSYCSAFSQREREIAELEEQADKKHDMYGNKTLYEVSGEVAAIYESQKALRLRLESIEEKLDELLRTQKGLG